MKYFLIIFFIGGAAMAQPAPTSSFDVDAIKVIYKPTLKNIANVSVYFRGGVTNYPAEKAGIEKLAVDGAVECGNAKYDKNSFKDKSDNFGIEIDATAGLDNAKISLNCLTKYFNEGWDLLSTAITTPVFDEFAFEKLKQKAISAINQAEGNPDQKLRTMAIQNAFAGTAYAINPAGTEPIISSLTATDVKAYYQKILLNKSRMFIVVVGNIKKEEIIAKIKSAFASVPATGYQPTPPATPKFSDASVTVEERSIATNYIMGIMNAPAYTSPDFVPYVLAISELHGGIFYEVRTKRNLSYAPDAGVRELLSPFTYVYVSTTNPKEAVEVMTNIINDQQQTSINKQGLNEIKALYITGSYKQEESTDAIADNLGRSEILGSWEIAEQFPTMVKNATRSEMSKAFKKYITGIKWTYLGDKQKADEAMRSFTMRIK
ncbi:MAG: insulinase family protein [Bacteroidetes bacterium]|nr:insulinase family protein [Bacteroidota bacterium]